MEEESQEPNYELPGDLRLAKLQLELSLQENEAISAVSSHQSNVYVGTTLGRIHHFHWFEDAKDYTPILQLQVNEKKLPIDKFLMLPDVDLCLVLSNRTIYPYTLPELSPYRAGKVKDVNDMLALSQVKNPKVKNPLDKIIVYTSSKIRVVQFLKDSIKLLKDINYQNAVLGRSSAAGTLANYSNICLVANDTNYDVVDMQQTRRIPLFEYNIDKAPNVHPYIVPFAAQDQESKEEHLLSIRSDASTSLAMFVNSFGDVTRGTLTWLGTGYPTNGLCVLWPYVFGIYRTEEDASLKLVTSSLTSLEVVSTLSIEGLYKARQMEPPKDIKIAYDSSGIQYLNERLLDLLSVVKLDKSFVPKYIRGHTSILLHDESSIYLLHEENKLYTAFQVIENALTLLESDQNQLLREHLKQNLEMSPVIHKLYRIYLLICGEIEEAKSNVTTNNDVLMFLYLFESDLTNDAWKEFSTEQIVLDCLDKFKPLEDKHQFRLWLLDSKYKFELSSNLQSYLRQLIYQEKTGNDLMNFIDKDIALWKQESTINDNIMSTLTSLNQHMGILHIQLQLQASKPSEERAKQITNLCLSLLNGTTKDGSSGVKDDGNASCGERTIDLVETAFSQLSNHFEDTGDYTKHILELFKLHPDRGVALLEANRGGKHRASHRQILEELSKSHDMGPSFSKLKLELMEQSFVESTTETKLIDFTLVDELLNELSDHLALNKGLYKDDLENLAILFNAFKHHNSLRDGLAHQISWIDFLGIHGQNSESKELVQVYLKIYELLTYKHHHDKPITKVEFKVESDAFEMLNKLFLENDKIQLISHLNDIGDFYSADYAVLFGRLPFPKLNMYISDSDRFYENDKPQSDADIKKSALHLAKLYLANQDRLSRLEGVKQVFQKYGVKYFQFMEVIEFLPDDFPLHYALEYLTSVLLGLENAKDDSTMKKALVKANARTTRLVYEDFKYSYRNVLDKQDQ